MNARRLVPSIILACGIAAVCLAVAGGVLVAVMVARFDAQLEAETLSKEAAAAWAERGKPVVEAVYRYKHTQGLWPHRLDDLVPRFATAAQVEPWDYWWSHWGEWEVSNRTQFPGGCALYRKGRFGTGWVLSLREGEEPLGVEQPVPEPEAVAEDELDRRILAELRRRIEREPDEMAHAQGLISRLIRHGRLQEARTECEALVARLPGRWWPHAALALIDVKLGSEDEAVRRLTAWVAQARRAETYLLLARFCEPLGRHGEALAAVRAIVELGRIGETERFTPSAILYEGACYALGRGEPKLVLELCDLWEQEASYSEQSYHALRAAAHLALGHFGEAKAHHAKAVEKRRRQVTWASHLDELGQAIAARDTGFRYTLRRTSFEILIDYE